MQSLKKLFHYNREEHQAEYERRFNDKDTVHLDILVSGNPSFFCQTIEMYQKLLSIEKTDKHIAQLCYSLPGAALKQFAQRCLIDEIVLTNNIEGVHSTRKEISSILSDLQKQNKRRRFVGLVKKYDNLMTLDNISINNSSDIRAIYDDIFYDEIQSTDPESLPDGQVFRSNSVSVYSATGKEIHIGLMPESEIISAMDKALDFLNNSNINGILRIAVFHYLFGYIHPFYDGNGRTSRFISSYCLSRELNKLIGYRISYTIKENISKYYKAFDTCNSPMNKGDLTTFVEMFLNIVEISESQLYDALTEREHNLHHYLLKAEQLPHFDEKNVAAVYGLLVQACLFSDNGISTKELQEHTNSSYYTLMKNLKKIPEKLVIKTKLPQGCYYKLDLNEIDKEKI